MGWITAITWPMIRLTSPINWMSCLGSCLAVATACGRHVDSIAREEVPVSLTAGVVASPPPSAVQVAEKPTEVDSSKPIRLTAVELDLLVRRAEREGTLINVWATWCGPCREELPMLAKVHKKYAHQGLAVLPLSVDEPEKEAVIPSMLKGYGFDGPYYVAAKPLDELKRSLSERWPGNIPVSFLLDRSAKPRFFWTAQVYENELVPKLDLFLQGKLKSGQANFAVAPGKTF